MVDKVQVVREFAITQQIAKTIQMALKEQQPEDMEAAQTQMQDHLDKQIASRLASVISARLSGFGQ
jgi:hypothetical protein